MAWTQEGHKQRCEEGEEQPAQEAVEIQARRAEDVCTQAFDERHARAFRSRRRHRHSEDAIDTAQNAVMQDQHSETSGAESDMIPDDDVIMVDDPLPAPIPPTSPRKRRNAPNSAEASGSAGSAGGPARKKARNTTRGTSRKVQPAAADEFKESTPIPDDEVSAFYI